MTFAKYSVILPDNTLNNKRDENEKNHTRDRSRKAD